jgi:hypothetical protein
MRTSEFYLIILHSYFSVSQTPFTITRAVMQISELYVGCKIQGFMYSFNCRSHLTCGETNSYFNFSELQVVQRFQELFSQTKYKEAAELAAESPQGLLRTPETVAKFQVPFSFCCL